jgi:DNA-binding IscR family transcriptional regulator
MNSLSLNHTLMVTLAYFKLVAMVLERFVSKGDAALVTSQISQELGVAATEIEDVCRRLAVAGVLVEGPMPGQWLLAVSPGDITLEDVWRVIGGICALGPTECRDDEQNTTFKIELITHQAMLGLDQNIAAHLRRFRLDCVAASKPGLVCIKKKRSYEPDVDAVESA